MCRFIIYKGNEPIQLSHLVTRPRHSIINQAFESKLRMPSSRPMNADGFGIGWYDAFPPAPIATVLPPAGNGHVTPVSSKSGVATPVRGEENDGEAKGQDEKTEEIMRLREEEQIREKQRPCVYKSLSPAWSNANLTRLAEKIRSPLVFAHVRASTTPGARKLSSHHECPADILIASEDNCHPWIFDKLMWMHNGEVAQFHKIKRVMQMSLPEELFLYPSGYTDSEWTFMVFLSFLKNPHARSFSHVELRNAMLETIKYINKLCRESSVDQPCLLNYVVTDGETVVATRYVSSRTSEASSLFFSSGTSFDETEESGSYRMTKADKRESIIVIASEPLTFERSEWMEVKTNTMIVITPKMNLLQIPIIDEFWVVPQDPASHHRSKDLAISMGFGLGFAYDMADSQVGA